MESAYFLLDPKDDIFYTSYLRNRYQQVILHRCKLLIYLSWVLRLGGNGHVPVYNIILSGKMDCETLVYPRFTVNYLYHFHIEDRISVSGILL